MQRREVTKIAFPCSQLSREEVYRRISIVFCHEVLGLKLQKLLSVWVQRSRDKRLEINCVKKGVVASLVNEKDTVVRESAEEKGEKAVLPWGYGAFFFGGLCGLPG